MNTDAVVVFVFGVLAGAMLGEHLMARRATAALSRMARLLKDTRRCLFHLHPDEARILEAAMLNREPREKTVARTRWPGGDQAALDTAWNALDTLGRMLSESFSSPVFCVTLPSGERRYIFARNLKEAQKHLRLQPETYKDAFALEIS